MHVAAYIISTWSRNSEGNVPQFILDSIANGWPAKIDDITDQPSVEIRLGHAVLIELTSTAETLDAIRKSGKYTIISKDGEVTDDEKKELSRLVDDIERLPPRATREMAKQLMVERFREQGARDLLKEAAKDVLRELAPRLATDSG